MKIKMAGIDHHKASVMVREEFSMTASAVKAALTDIQKTEEIEGCVIISTCNRTEYWLSVKEEAFRFINPIRLLCEEKEKKYELYQSYFTVREGMDAVHYLMELCCGIQSQIFGDDQIISQIKCAVELARETDALDSVLETLFRDAIAGGKRVKSQVVLQNMDRSVAAAMCSLLQKQKIKISGKRCMVIGNGEIGRLAAQELVKAGGKVFMTLRQYKKKDVMIPAGCSVISYDSRYEYLDRMDIVVSATVSPHFTLTAAQVKLCADLKNKVLIDLAIPRDIEPEIAELPGMRLYDMDSFADLKSRSDSKQIEAADKILKKYEMEFKQWYEFREFIPIVKKISSLAGDDTAMRLQKELKRYPLSREERMDLCEKISGAASKVVAKFCYGFREEMEKEQWKPCLLGMLSCVEDGQTEKE